MNMADVVALLKEDQEQRNLETEDFAHLLGVRVNSLYSYFREDKPKSLGIKNARKIARFYYDIGDMDKVRKIASYLVEIDLTSPKQKPATNNN